MSSERRLTRASRRRPCHDRLSGAELPDAEFGVPGLVFEGDVLYLEWTAEAPTVRVTDGTDTFVLSPDGIRVHTLHYSVDKLGQVSPVLRQSGRQHAPTRWGPSPADSIGIT